MEVELSAVTQISEDELDIHVIEVNTDGKDRRKGTPIPGVAREVILKVAAVCEQEAKDNIARYPLNAPTKRAALYSGVSERTIQRFRNEDKKRKLSQQHDASVENKIRGYPDEESIYNSMKRKSKKGQTIPWSARNIISKVIEACDREYKDYDYLAPLICKSKRTALYTGVSQRTVQRIKIEDEQRNKIDEEKVLVTPGKERKRTTFNDKIDDFDFYSIRKLIDEILFDKKVSPTCTSLHSAVKEKIEFPYSINTLYRLLHSKGFIWHKSQKGKRVLLEKPEFFRTRLDYLQKIKNYEEQGKFIIYLDDVWTGPDKKDSHCSKGIFGVKGGICCSGRLVVLSEFSERGFVRRAERLFKPNIVASEEPNIATVDKWMKENLFPNIPANSLIVMSTSTYKKEDHTPNEYSPKTTLVKYLKQKKIKHDPRQKRLTLFENVKSFLAQLPCKWSRIDKIIEDQGHTVLRLPHYMSEFSPIELAWADVKRCVKDKSTCGKISLKVINELTLEATGCLHNDTLQGYVDHVIQMENYFWSKQKVIEEHYESTINKNGNDKEDNNGMSENSCTVTSYGTIDNSNISNSVLQNAMCCYSNTALSLNTAAFPNPTTDVAVYSYTSVLPTNQLIFVNHQAVPVLTESTSCDLQGLESGVIQAGPSYLNL